MSILSSIGKVLGSVASSAVSTLFPGSKLGSIAGSALSSLSGAASQQTQQDNNLQLANQQFQNQMVLQHDQQAYNTEMWNKQNEYNSPSAQVQRLEEAGINPLFGITGSTASGNATSSATSGQGSASSAVPASSLLEHLVNAKQLQALDSQIEKTNAETKQTTQETEKTSTENEILKSDAKFRDSYNKGIIELNDSQILLNNQNRDLSKSNVDKVRKEIVQIDQNVKNMSQEFENLRATYNEILADTDVKRASAYLSQVQAKYVPMVQSALADMYQAQGYSAYQAGKLATEQSRQVGQQIENLKSDNTIKGIQIKLGNNHLKIDNILTGDDAQSAARSKVEFDANHSDMQKWSELLGTMAGGLKNASSAAASTFLMLSK